MSELSSLWNDSISDLFVAVSTQSDVVTIKKVQKNLMSDSDHNAEEISNKIKEWFQKMKKQEKIKLLEKIKAKDRALKKLIHQDQLQNISMIEIQSEEIKKTVEDDDLKKFESENEEKLKEESEKESKEDSKSRNKKNENKDLKSWKFDDESDLFTQTVLEWRLFNADESYTLNSSWIESTFFLRNVYLSNWWVERIIWSSLVTKQRCKYWSEDFNFKKYVLIFWKNKETSYKIENKNEIWWYVIAIEWYQLHETEKSSLKIVKNESWIANKKLVLDDKTLVQENNSLKFNEIIQEDMKEIKTEFIRIMKWKIRKRSSLSLISVESKTRFDVMNSMKSKRFIKFIFDLINLIKFFTSRQLFKLIQIVNSTKLSFIKSLEFMNFSSLFKLLEFKRNKETKRIQIDNIENLQITLKNESEINMLNKKRKVILFSATDHSLFLVSSDLDDDKILKHLKLLKNFMIHSEFYRVITTETLAQFRSLLKANSLLWSAYDQLRIRSNILVKKQTALRAKLKKLLMKKKN